MSVTFLTQEDKRELQERILTLENSLWGISICGRYASMEHALLEKNQDTNGSIGTYYDTNGNYHVVLLTDIESNATIALTRDCIFHLNGKKLSFTAADAHLSIHLAKQVIIDGQITGSEITKNVSDGSNEKVVSSDGTSLHLLGGTYSAYGTYTTAVIPIRTESANTAMTMDGCALIVEGSAGTAIRGMQLKGEATIRNCDIRVINSNGAAIGIKGSAQTNVEECTIVAKSSKKGVDVQAIACEGTKTLTVTNCDIRADGYADSDTNGDNTYEIYGCYAIYTTTGPELIVNGGYYYGAREALSVHGTARINGGVFEGCEHGGAYLSGADIKVKNATFRGYHYNSEFNVNGSLKGNDWDEGGYCNGAVYCGSSTDTPTNVWFDHCCFEGLGSIGTGIVAKYTDTYVYVSNSTIIGSFADHLRADYGNVIYVGKDVVYEIVNTYGPYVDTQTYAGQSFNWE